MATRKVSRPSAKAASHGPGSPTTPQLVSGRWLLRALGVTLLVALVCGWLTVCLLFYQGRWQLLFHPAGQIAETPASIGLPFDEIRFDTTETGSPRLAGWWIPAEAPSPIKLSGGSNINAFSATRYGNLTILYFHKQSGNLGDALPQLTALHLLGVNIFAFDYRGFGRSASLHPSEDSVYEDGDAAWSYLVATRHIESRSIILYGERLGATIAAEVARRHPGVPAIVLENPAPPALEIIHADERTGVVPVRLLFGDRFELLPRLKSFGYTPQAEAEQRFLGHDTGPTLESIQYEPPPGLKAPAVLGLFSNRPASAYPTYAVTLRRFLDMALASHP